MLSYFQNNQTMCDGFHEGGERMSVAAFRNIIFGLACASSSVQASSLVVHEWGTFTSLQDSQGKRQEGLYREEHGLPDFVNGRCKLASNWSRAHGMGQKCMDFTPLSGSSLAVSQKMETPVIYFYSDEAQVVTVQVDFPRGIISQWYPDPISFTPKLKLEDPAPLASSMTWKLEVLLGERTLPGVSGFENIWRPSRQVTSNFIKVGDQNEKFIFYRGLGEFSLPLKIKSTDDGHFVIKNSSSEDIPAIFVLQIAANGLGTILPLGSLQGHSSSNFQDQDLASSLSVASSDLNSFRQALTKAGLFEDEAIAMVNTWKESYFRKPGLRVLYVMPRAWVDSILPIHISPQPEQLARVMVGRIEVMSAREEASLLAEFHTRAESGAVGVLSTGTMTRLGILAEPKLRRLSERVEAKWKKRIEDYLDREFGLDIL